MLFIQALRSLPLVMVTCGMRCLNSLMSLLLSQVPQCRCKPVHPLRQWQSRGQLRRQTLLSLHRSHLWAPSMLTYGGAVSCTAWSLAPQLGQTQLPALKLAFALHIELTTTLCAWRLAGSTEDTSRMFGVRVVTYHYGGAPGSTRLLRWVSSGHQLKEAPGTFEIAAVSLHKSTFLPSDACAYLSTGNKLRDINMQEVQYLILAVVCSLSLGSKIPLDMALDAVDDMYDGCSKDALNKFVLSDLLQEEMNQSIIFQKAWHQSQSACPKLIPGGLKQHTTALLTIASDDDSFRKTLNNAVFTDGANSTIYEEHFNYKSIHFLLMDSLRLLHTAEEFRVEDVRTVKEDEDLSYHLIVLKHSKLKSEHNCYVFSRSPDFNFHCFFLALLSPFFLFMS
uniref:NAD(P)(+)--arginine ADP-ribosyltransferase n=1 Tax=Knipowitschia caucasica TaxID=637954 RepID=A0AAV2LLJ4_KNICA